MPIPSLFTSGDTIKWRDSSGLNWLNESVTSGDYTLKYYLRSPDGGAHTVTGTSWGNGWEFSISAADSAGFDPGTWYFKAVATKSGDTVTLDSGQFEVKASLTYTGSTPGPYDGRTQTKKDLDDVTAAIRSIIKDKAKSYSIGNRTFTRLDLPELRARESQLKAEVVRERKADMIANGLGDPHSLYVRF